MFVKICGITVLEDALLAIDAGADMLGFNFFKRSPRHIPPQIAGEITQELRSRGYKTEVVGVFVNHPPQMVQEIIELCNLDSIQLSGDESPDELASYSGRAFKAIRPSNLDGAEQSAALYARLDMVPALLLDASVPGMYGGTGRQVDLQLAKLISAKYHVLLAGGLNCENLAQVLDQVTPWGIDVASGVELEPGRKDKDKIREFVNIAKRSF